MKKDLFSLLPQRNKEGFIHNYAFSEVNEIILPVSSSTGAGISDLWRLINRWASNDSFPAVGTTSKFVFILRLSFVYCLALFFLFRHLS
jgi:hypothetical protein